MNAIKGIINALLFPASASAKGRLGAVVAGHAVRTRQHTSEGDHLHQDET